MREGARLCDRCEDMLGWVMILAVAIQNEPGTPAVPIVAEEHCRAGRNLKNTFSPDVIKQHVKFDPLQFDELRAMIILTEFFTFA
jgi:hypothetical protein